MSNAMFDLIRFTTATTGTGTITVGAAVAPFATPAAAGVPDGTQIEYSINDGLNSEKGFGVTGSSGTTLTRNVLTAYVNNVAQSTPINLSGSAQVFIDPSSMAMGPLSAFQHSNCGGL